MTTLYGFGSNVCHQINSTAANYFIEPVKLSFDDCVKITLDDVPNPSNVDDPPAPPPVLRGDSIIIKDVKISWSCVVALNVRNEPLVWCISKDVPTRTSLTFTSICLGITNVLFDLTTKSLLMSNDEFQLYKVIRINELEANSQGRDEGYDEFIDIRSTGDENLFFLTQSNKLYQSELAPERCRSLEFVNLQPINFATGLNNRFFSGKPKIKQVTCGQHHTICLSFIGILFSFGNGNQGQLGLGSLDYVEDPLMIEALAGVQIVKVCAGGWHNLAISDRGDIFAWGWNNFGQVGLPYKESETLYSDEEDADAEDLPAAMNDRRLTKASTASNPNAAFLPYVQIQTIPRALDIPNPCKTHDLDEPAIEDEVDAKIIDIACGTRHSICLTDNNEVYSWGWNKVGQLGLGSRLESQWEPGKVEFFSNHKVKSIYAGGWNSIVITETEEPDLPPQ